LNDNQHAAAASYAAKQPNYAASVINKHQDAGFSSRPSSQHQRQVFSCISFWK